MNKNCNAACSIFDCLPYGEYIKSKVHGGECFVYFAASCLGFRKKKRYKDKYVLKYNAGTFKDARI